MALGTTINGLNTVTSLTAQDDVPVWDVEASGEPTKKITAQNMAASVKTLGSLVNTSEMNSALAGKQNTLTFDSTPTTGSTNPVTSGGIATAITQSTANFEYQANTIAELNAIISGLGSAARTTVFLGTTVISTLIGQNASGTAVMTKMDADTVDMIIYSLGGNYVGAVRYSKATSSVSKELPVYQRYIDVPITVGSTQYQGYYYGDTQISVTDDRIRSVLVFAVTSNRPAFAIRISASNYRVFTTVADTTVTLRVFYV